MKPPPTPHPISMEINVAIAPSLPYNISTMFLPKWRVPPPARTMQILLQLQVVQICPYEQSDNIFYQSYLHFFLCFP